MFLFLKYISMCYCFAFLMSFSLNKKNNNNNGSYFYLNGAIVGCFNLASSFTIPFQSTVTSNTQRLIVPCFTRQRKGEKSFKEVRVSKFYFILSTLLLAVISGGCCGHLFQAPVEQTEGGRQQSSGTERRVHW